MKDRNRFSNKITKSKQAELALQNSDALYRTLVEKMPDGVYKSTHDGKFVDVNPAMVKILGYESKEELMAIDIKSQLYFEPGDRESIILEEQLEEMGIFRLKKKDGSEIWVEDHGWYNLGENGEILFHEGILRDITDRRHEELERQIIYEISQSVAMTENLNELMKSIHQSLRKVLYAENCYMALYDKNTGLFSFPYYVDQFDTTPEPVEMPKSCTAYVLRVGKPVLVTPVLFRQLAKQNEMELVGSPSPSWVGVPLKTPVGTIGVLVLQHYEKENVYSEHDIQFLDSVGSQIAVAIERRQAEVELRKERLLLRTVIDNIPDSIYCKDTAGRKTLANHTELLFSQINSESEILGKTDFDLYPKEIAEGFFADDQVVLQTGQPVINREEYVFDNNGMKKWLLTSKLPMKDEYGNITGIVGIGRDITNRKQTEAEIKLKNEELLCLNAEKDKFFSIIAHDLKGPFNGFLGLTQIMAEELPSLNVEEVQNIAVSMRDSAKNLYHLLENLLDWSQIQKGAFPFNPEVIRLGEVVSNSINLIHEAAKRKNIEISILVADGLLVFADMNMIQTVIRNLVLNAIKFTNRGGKVSILTKSKSDNIELSIHDTGIGMNQNMIKNLFRIDVKTNRNGTEDEPSTGLGLLLCKEFTEKNGGKIWVESAEGEGSTFYFTLPVYTSPESESNNRTEIFIPEKEVLINPEVCELKI